MTDQATPEHPSSPPASTRLRRLFSRALLSLLLVAFASLLIILSVGIEEVRTALESVSRQTILLLLCISSLNYLARATRWVLLFRDVDRRGRGRDLAAVPRQFLIYLGGNAFTLTPGRAGEAVRAWMASESFGTPAAAGLSLVVADRFYDAVALTIILLIVGLVLAREMTAPLIMIVVLGSAILIVSKASSAQGFWEKLAHFVPRLSGLVLGAGRMISNLSVITRPNRMPIYTLPSLAGWLLQGLAPAIILNDMGVSLGWANSVFVFALATLVGGASFLPGGLGGFEVTMIALLSAMDIPLSTALAATLVLRLTTLWFGVALGLATFTVWTILSTMRQAAQRE